MTSDRLSSSSSLRTIFPPVVVIRAGLAWAVLAAFQVNGEAWLAAPLSPSIAIGCFGILFATILAASFGVVREADLLARQVGEPYGSLILTLSIVSIDCILIASVMLGPGEFPTIGRDSIFAVMMIILNLVTGLCLVLGGLRFGEQEYNSQGAIAYISMAVVLTGTALVLPNSLSTSDGTFWPGQAIALSILTVLLYGAFLGMQMRSYRRFFMQPDSGSLSISLQQFEKPDLDRTDAHRFIESPKGTSFLRSILLVVMLVPIVLLGHDLAILIDYGVGAVGAPVALGGILIAIIVFTPESVTAIGAATGNEMQRSLNLCLGAFVSTVGLTVPVVLIIGMMTGQRVVMGIGSTETTLFLMTIALSALSFLGQRTSIIQGLMHLMLFGVFTILVFST